MTIRDFCDAGLALIVDDFQRQGVLLADAWDRLKDWTTGERVYQESVTRDTRATTARQNEDALSQITAALAGTRA